MNIAKAFVANIEFDKGMLDIRQAKDLEKKMKQMLILAAFGAVLAFISLVLRLDMVFSICGAALFLYGLASSLGYRKDISTAKELAAERKELSCALYATASRQGIKNSHGKENIKKIVLIANDLGITDKKEALRLFEDGRNYSE